MTDSIVKLFDSAEIRFVNHPENKFAFGIVAEDLAAVLEASSGKDVARSIDDEWKGLLPVDTPGGVQKVTVIWEPGIRQLLSRSRKPKAKDLALFLGMNEIIAPPVETKNVAILSKAFADCDPCTQFFCCGYRVDLYLAKPRIAIECDENGHKSYHTKKERQREQEIKNALGCSFVRFNPHDPSFNIGDVIFKIRELV